MSLIDNLPHTCTIRRKVLTKDSLGGNLYTYEVEQTSVPCWEQGMGASETGEFQKRGITANRNVFFASNPNVTERHEILITSRLGVAVSSDNQTVLDVVSFDQPDASVGIGILFKVVANSQSGTAQ